MTTARSTLLFGTLIGIPSALATLSCSREYLTTAETDVVVTFEAKGQDYSKYKTYSAPDQVTDLCEAASDEGDEGSRGGLGGAGGRPSFDSENCVEADHRLDDELLAALRRNMDALGYEEVDPEDEEPDVALFVGVVAQDNWYLATSPGYCDPYYYYYSCWYPTYSYPYNLPTNAYVIDMADMSESDQGKLASVWTAILKGLDESSADVSGKERINDAVDQAFTQSKYLAEGGN